MAAPAWLPSRILYSDFGGDWNRFLAKVYAAFEDDLLKDFNARTLRFEGTRLSLRRHPIVRGKEASFWHLVSTGKIEEDRMPDLRRCECVCWVRPVIDHVGDPSIKRWENTRNGDTNICLWLESEGYLVVLGKRNGYALLLTAYLVEQYREKRLEQEYQTFLKSKS